MFKRYLSSTVTEEEWPIWRVIAIFAITLLIGLGGALFFFFGPTWKDISGDIISPTTSTRPINLEVSSTLLAIPSNYTRYGRDRRGSKRDNVELHALLPDLNGYTINQAEAFESSALSSDLLLITITRIEHNMTPNRLIDDVYQPILSKGAGGGGLDAKTGLKKSFFAKDSMYANATFYETTLRVDDSQKSPFYICAPSSNHGAWCTGRLRIGTTAQAIFRFSEEHLKDWEEINQRLSQKLSQFRADARKEN